MGEPPPFQLCLPKIIILVPVARNHGKLYNEILDLVLGSYGVIYSDVNDMGTGVGGGKGNGSVCPVRA